MSGAVLSEGQNGPLTVLCVDTGYNWCAKHGGREGEGGYNWR